MREKELRLALICYGGISLAVYMHGITKEIWRLTRASRNFHDNQPVAGGSQAVYRELLEIADRDRGVRIRVIADIIAGASAGGINGVFLAQAIATGQSLEPLTALWLEKADVDVLLDPDARPLSAFTKFWARPIVWFLARRKGGTIERTVDPDTRDEVTLKLSNFVRARWFRPPFGGRIFCGLLLDAFDAMAKTPADAPLLPASQPLDLFVTVTDFRGHPQMLRLNSPSMVTETEHRLIISFRADRTRGLGDSAGLVMAARATASFPGAFPPFTVAELDGVLRSRAQQWPDRDAFISRTLPQHDMGGGEHTVLIDGSVLANAPFRPAIAALKNRPARREVDRRFVYIDPKPGMRSVTLGARGEVALPGFLSTIFGALSDIPREQPIRDNLETIEGRSARIRRTQRIIDALRIDVNETVQTLFGRTLFLDRPTQARLESWRSRAQDRAARDAGHAYPAYGHLKLSHILDELAETAVLLARSAQAPDREAIRQALWTHVRSVGIDRIGETASRGARETVIDFFRDHDLGFRIRRLRFLAQTLTTLGETGILVDADFGGAHACIYECLSLFLDREIADFYGDPVAHAAIDAAVDPQRFLRQMAEARQLRLLDAAVDDMLARALCGLKRDARRPLLLAYLGFPFFDIATLPLIGGESSDEFNTVKVDRISPEDAVAIRMGGAAATLKGIQFNSFGAFFSRAFRENDYLWGRLHGADRLIDILASTLPETMRLDPQRIATAKQAAFRSILTEERPRLTRVGPLIDEIEREIDRALA